MDNFNIREPTVLSIKMMVIDNMMDADDFIENVLYYVYRQVYVFI